MKRAVRQGAGLVEHDRVDAREALECPRPLDENTFARRSPERSQDGGRDAHARRGAVVGDEDRHRGVEAPRERTAETGQRECAPDFAIGQPLGEELDVRFFRGGGLDGAHDPAHGRVRPELLGANLDLAVLERRGREDAIARETLDRQRLAGHRLLIHHRLAADDRAVDGDALTCRDDDDVSRVKHADVDRLATIAGPSRHDPLGHPDDVAERRPRSHDAARHDELAHGAYPRQERGGREIAPRDQERERRGLQDVSVQPPTSGRASRRPGRTPVRPTPAAGRR